MWGHGVISKGRIFVCHLLDFLEQNEDNTGRCTNNPDVIGAPTLPPHRYYARCPSLQNPPNLSWLGTGIKYAGCKASGLEQQKLFSLFCSANLKP